MLKTKQINNIARKNPAIYGRIRNPGATRKMRRSGDQKLKICLSAYRSELRWVYTGTAALAELSNATGLSVPIT